MNPPTKNVLHRKDDDLDLIIALSAALSVTVSVAIGAGIGVAWFLVSPRKKRVSLIDVCRLVIIAGAVILFSILIRDWDDFKAGLMAGWSLT